ncbi:MAG: ornithine cyclodeaminase family protein [Anaerolineae bacterium]|nr:ornithine cyclodeaminase family protein [Anaerolineales bacterium]MCQ3979042.1 ornithine cyclodeaminase family protein [Anaerolineae bacterium]
MKIRILSAADVRRALPMGEAIEAMRSAFGQLSANQADMPLRTRLQTDQGLLLFMPAFLRQSREIGFKMVSLWGDNPAKGLPAVIALATVIDPDTGEPKALLNGEMLTAIRTGAGGGLATDLLARSDAKVAAVFGAGVQARAQLEAACAVRAIKEVRIFSRTPARVEAFAAEVVAWPDAPQVVVAGSRREAVTGADIVIAATTSEKPVFDGRDLLPGTHVTGVGSYAPHMQEVDEETVRRSKIVVDSLQACLAEAGDLIVALEKNVISKLDIHAELGQIVNGERPGRESHDEITFFKSVGVAVQDAAAANAVLRAAESQGLGTVVAL